MYMIDNGMLSSESVILCTIKIQLPSPSQKNKLLYRHFIDRSPCEVQIEIVSNYFRNIYYENVPLHESQAAVNRSVHQLTLLLGVPRDALHVTHTGTPIIIRPRAHQTLYR